MIFKRWGLLVLSLGAVAGLAGCKSVDDQFKEAFNKEFKTSCLSSAQGTGAPQGPAKTYCDCMGDGLVKNYNAAELTAVSAKIAATPEETLVVAEKIGCSDAMQPVFKASFEKSFVDSCLQGAPDMKDYCTCYATGLLKRHDARGLMKLSTDMEKGSVDPVKLAKELGCLPEDPAAAPDAVAAPDAAAAPDTAAAPDAAAAPAPAK